MIHLNGDLLCVIHCAMTGPSFYEHSLCEVACIPLNTFLQPHDEKPVFNIVLQPEGEQRDSRCISEPAFTKARNKGFSYAAAGSIFDAWFEKLGLTLGKRIIPLALNWRLQYDFLVAWLGFDSMNFYFDPRYRDIASLSCSLCDSADQHAEPIPFNHTELRHLCGKLSVQWDTVGRSDTLYEAYKIAEAYKRMVGRITFI